METADADIDITFKRRVAICLRLLGVSWRTRPLAIVCYFAGVILEIGASLSSIYATARLGALVATFVSNGQTDGIWFWLWMDIVALAAVGLGFLAMDYFKRMLYFSFVRWSTNTFLSALC